MQAPQALQALGMSLNPAERLPLSRSPSSPLLSQLKEIQGGAQAPTARVAKVPWNSCLQPARGVSESLLRSSCRPKGDLFIDFCIHIYHINTHEYTKKIKNKIKPCVWASVPRPRGLRVQACLLVGSTDEIRRLSWRFWCQPMWLRGMGSGHVAV